MTLVKPVLENPSFIALSSSKWNDTDDLDNALWRAGEVETLCHQYWAALQAGKPVILSDKLMTTVLARFKTYGKQPGQLKKGDALSVVGPVRRDVSKKQVPEVLAARKKARKQA